MAKQQQQQMIPQQQMKRRRVTRACDECRKKKVKCDGQQPCIHCTVYSYECTYKQPTKRSLHNSNTGNNTNRTSINSSSKPQLVNMSTINPSITLMSNSIKSNVNSTNNSNNCSAITSPNTSNTNTKTALNMNNIPNMLSTANNAYNNNNTNNIPTINSLPNANSTITARKSTTNNAKLQDQLNKYQQIFKELLPDMPDVNHMDVPTFLQIVHNFKENSHSILDDISKEYFLIVNDRSSPNQLQSPRISGSPEHMFSSSKNGSTTSVDTIDHNDAASLNVQVGREIKIILPPKPIALQFVKNTWEHCCVLLRFFHRPSFLNQLEELYETDPNNYTSEQMNFLPLCYSTMAVGALFSKSIEDNDNTSSPSSNNEKEGSATKQGVLDKNNFLQDEGYKYFIAARKLIDITNTRDLNSIQTVLMLFIFLQCSARLSTCYAYIGVAMRSALREGFHRKVPQNSGLSPIQIEIRKRLFFTIYKLDIYVNAMLGLPRSISPDDFDQDLPVGLSDENITDEDYFPERQNGILSSSGIANCHTKLLIILDDIVRVLYPIKRTNNIISHDIVTQLELQLKRWAEELPNELKPNNKLVPQRYERANKLLHLSFLHVQIILYRPFIHYLSRNFTAHTTDALSLQRARNSIAVARTVVRMAQEMVSKNLIPGSYWYACYTIFYSVAGLLFYIHEADLPDKDSAREYYEILKDAERGRNVLIQLKDTSMAANRTYNILNKIFEKLNSKTIQLTNMHLVKDNKNIGSQDANSVALSDVSRTSSYNIEKFVRDVPVLSAPDSAPDSVSNEVQTKLKNPSFSQINSSNLPSLANEDDISLKMEPNKFNPVFGYDGNQNELFGVTAPNITTPTFDANYESKDVEYGNKTTLSFIDDEKTADSDRMTEDAKVKMETFESDLNILNVFDQLDQQLFGRYVSQDNIPSIGERDKNKSISTATNSRDANLNSDAYASSQNNNNNNNNTNNN